jgi:hypothetical protein
MQVTIRTINKRSQVHKIAIKLKTQVILITLLHLATVLYSQTDSNSQKILTELVRNIQPESMIYYTERVDNNILYKHFDALLKGTIIGTTIRTRDRMLSLSKSEIKYLISQLKRSAKSSWPEFIFTNSRRIQLDSIPNFMEEKRNELADLRKYPYKLDSLRKAGKSYFDFFRFFEFSDVVYLRNKSFFVNYLMWFNGNGGHEELAFYKWESEKWVKWIVAAGGNW